MSGAASQGSGTATQGSGTAAQEAPVVFEELALRDGWKLGVARLNRPRQLNALNLEMCELLLTQLRRWQSDQAVVAVWLEGAGDKGFCAGGDVAGVIREVRKGGPERFVYGDAFFEVEYQLDALIHRYPKPFLSYSHGVNMGGGLGLVAGASHRIVAEGSRIAMPEIHIGLFPDVGGGFFMNRVPGGAGRLLALTGQIINEADALFAGLADYFVPREARDDLLRSMQAAHWGADATGNRAMLTTLLLGVHRRFHLGLPTSTLRQYFDAIRFVAAQPTVIALRDALVTAAAEDPYFKPMADSLVNGSPTGAHVTFEYLQRTRLASIEQVLQLDLVLARQFQRHHDFPEGVRALLIDKDRQPRWSPATFAEVPDTLVQAHFRPE